VSADPRAVLLDIEGTTTPLHFVTRVLFPWAHERLGEYLARNWAAAETGRDIAALRAEHQRDAAAGLEPPAWEDTAEAATAYARWLMGQDRKVTPLKQVQGRIWEEGFRSGGLEGQVYEDVPRAFARWREAGRRIAIFSSGSVLAQRLLFGHSNAGDLTPFLGAYFDTTTGPKREALSYRRIAGALGEDASSVLFVSDVAAELDAALEAGLATALCVREQGAPAAPGHPIVRTFDDLP
jgi:enolase-phosphatase E1